MEGEKGRKNLVFFFEYKVKNKKKTGEKIVPKIFLQTLFFSLFLNDGFSSLVFIFAGGKQCSCKGFSSILFPVNFRSISQIQFLKL